MRRSLRRSRVRDTPPLLITSMLDMFTIILVFLITFLDPDAPTANDPINLAPSSAEVVPVREGEVVMSVLRDTVKVGDRRIPVPTSAEGDGPPSEVADALRAARPAGLAEDATPPLRVLVDRTVPWATLSPLLRAAEDAGYGDFRFVVVQEDG